MRNDRPREGGYRSAFISHCGDQGSFIFLFGHHLWINLFPLPLTPAATFNGVGVVLLTVSGTSLFKIFAAPIPLSVFLCLYGRAYWWGRGWAWSQISHHEENMEFYNYLLFFPLWLNLFAIMKKSAKNCTHYHVVPRRLFIPALQ